MTSVTIPIGMSSQPCAVAGDVAAVVEAGGSGARRRRHCSRSQLAAVVRRSPAAKAEEGMNVTCELFIPEGTAARSFHEGG